MIAFPRLMRNSQSTLLTVKHSSKASAVDFASMWAMDLTSSPISNRSLVKVGVIYNRNGPLPLASGHGRTMTRRRGPWPEVRGGGTFRAPVNGPSVQYGQDGWGIQVGVVAEHETVELPQGESRLHAREVENRRPCVQVGLKRCCPQPGSVLHQYQLSPAPFQSRIFVSSRVQLRDQLPAVADRDLRVGAQVASDMKFADKLPGHGFHRQALRKCRELGVPPQRTSASQVSGRAPEIAAAKQPGTERDQFPELQEVQLGRPDLEPVTGALVRQGSFRHELPAQPGYIGVHEVSSATRNVLRPAELKNFIGGQHLVRVNEENGQQGTEACLRDGQVRPVVPADLELTEERVMHF